MLNNLIERGRLLQPDDYQNGGMQQNEPQEQGTNQNTSSRPAYAGSMVEVKDPVTGQTVKVPEELNTLFGHVISHTRKSTESQYKPLVEKLQGETAELSEIKAEYQKLQEAQMSAEERAQANAARKIAEFENNAKIKEQEASKWREAFNNSKIENDIYGSFGDATKLYNPKQLALLMQQEGRARVEEVLDSSGKATGQFETVLELALTNESTGNLEIVTGTPAELFKRWIEEERNLHHQKNNLMPGANSSPGNKKGGKDYRNLSPEGKLDAVFGVK